jgi:hypothetical protein
MVGHDLFHSRQVSGFDLDRKRGRACVHIDKTPFTEIDMPLDRGEIDREFVAPMFAKLLQVAACILGFDHGFRFRHDVIPFALAAKLALTLSI